MSEKIIVDPTTGGMKGEKPYMYHTMPVDAMKEIAHVFYMGSRKYEPYNFRRGYAWSLSYNALRRHLDAFWGREDWNEETFEDRETKQQVSFKVRHIACAAWHAIVLTFFSITGRGTDDRPE